MLVYCSPVRHVVDYSLLHLESFLVVQSRMKNYKWRIIRWCYIRSQWMPVFRQSQHKLVFEHIAAEWPVGDGASLHSGALTVCGGICSCGKRRLVVTEYHLHTTKISAYPITKNRQVSNKHPCMTVCTGVSHAHALYMYFSFFLGHLPTYLKHSKNELGNRFDAVFDW